MSIFDPIPGNAPGLPKTARKALPPLVPSSKRGLVTQREWDELHDFLTLSLDALGDGPADMDQNFLVNLSMHQWLALQLTEKAMQRAIQTPRKLDRLDGCHQPRGGAQ